MRTLTVVSLLGPEFLPVRGTSQSVGLDLVAPHDIILPPGHQCVVDTGVVVRWSEGGCYTHVMCVPRSSAGIKKGVMIQNTVGIIDADYCGREDTIKVALFRREPMANLVGIFDASEFDRQNPALDGVFLSTWASDGKLVCRSQYHAISHGDEIHLFEKPNLSPSNNLLFSKGERFAQMVPIVSQPFECAFGDVSDLAVASRGGIGSTGE